MSDGGNSANRQFFTLLGGVVMINVLFYVICWFLGRNASTPIFLQVGNWIYGVVVVPLVCLVFSFVEVATTRLRMGWTGGFLVGCLIVSVAVANWAVYFFGGWLYA